MAPERTGPGYEPDTGRLDSWRSIAELGESHSARVLVEAKGTAVQTPRREIALDSPGFCAGWHAPDPGCRWTGGDATLAVSGIREMSFAVSMVGTYWQEAALRRVRVAS